jgi:hypothetical protein
MRAPPFSCAQNTEYLGKASEEGHPIVYWPGWQNNDARYSVQTDIMPLPISPVHFQNWPEMQFQLSNGWQYTNYGLRMPYDDYLRLLYSSTSSPGAPRPLPGQGYQPFAVGNPSDSQVQNQVFAPAAPSDYKGGVGILAPGVSLSGRTYYG